MIQLLRRRQQRGNALTEYVLLLLAVVILSMQAVVEYGRSVEGEFGGADSESVWEDVSSNMAGVPGTAGDGGCPYYFNPATGRWHDPETHLFVTFDSAGTSGCF